MLVRPQILVYGQIGFRCSIRKGRNRTISARDNKKNQTQINDEIRADVVRLIDEEGVMRGIVSIDEALSLAEEADLDLVLFLFLNSFNFPKYANFSIVPQGCFSLDQ